MKILLIILTLFLSNCKLNKIVNHHGIHNLEGKSKELFSLLQEASNLSDEEMLNTFNCGNGMVIVISKNELEKTIKSLTKLKIGFKVIGSCSNLKKGDSSVNIY